VRAALQVVLRRDETRPEYAPKLLDLVSHEESLSKKALEDIVLQARAVVEYARLPLELMSFAMSVLERVMLFWLRNFTVGEYRLTTAQIQYNAFNGWNEEHTAQFLCFDPRLALVNHSCIPKAYLKFDGRTALLNCAYPIKALEQITICYIGRCCLSHFAVFKSLKMLILILSPFQPFYFTDFPLSTRLTLIDYRPRSACPGTTTATEGELPLRLSLREVRGRSCHRRQLTHIHIYAHVLRVARPCRQQTRHCQRRS
jgi:hypothetical protein